MESDTHESRLKYRFFLRLEELPNLYLSILEFIIITISRHTSFYFYQGIQEQCHRRPGSIGLLWGVERQEVCVCPCQRISALGTKKVKKIG